MNYSHSFLAGPGITAMYARNKKRGAGEASKSWQIRDEFGNMAYRKVNKCRKAEHMVSSRKQ